jgi:hypothetical protein
MPAYFADNFVPRLVEKVMDVICSSFGQKNNVRIIDMIVTILSL